MTGDGDSQLRRASTLPPVSQLTPRQPRADTQRMEPRWHVYEHHVARVMRSEGWTCEVSRRGPDGGVDIIAGRKDERVAVQTKMYRASGRRVKTSDVRDLHGAAALAGCDRGMLVTDTDVPASVTAACRVLGIDIREIASDEMDDPPGEPPEHWLIWTDQVARLQGQTIERNGGEPSLITLVDGYGLNRITRGSSTRQPVPIAAFDWVVTQIREHGHVTQATFRSSEVRGRYAAFLFDLVAGLDGFDGSTSPTRALRLESKFPLATEALA